LVEYRARIGASVAYGTLFLVGRSRSKNPRSDKRARLLPCAAGIST
jgi:hypothetical protein